MHRTIPTDLLTHPGLTRKQREALADFQPAEHSPSQIEDIVRLVDATLQARLPGWEPICNGSIPWLPAARALITDVLREEKGFTRDECERGRANVAALSDPGKLLVMLFATRRESRTRKTRLLAAQYGCITAD